MQGKASRGRQSKEAHQEGAVTNGSVIDPVEAQKYYMIDSYAEFVKSEGVPVVEDIKTFPVRVEGEDIYVEV